MISICYLMSLSLCVCFSVHSPLSTPLSLSLCLFFFAAFFSLDHLCTFLCLVFLLWTPCGGASASGGRGEGACRDPAFARRGGNPVAYVRHEVVAVSRQEVRAATAVRHASAPHAPVRIRGAHRFVLSTPCHFVVSLCLVL